MSYLVGRGAPIAQLGERRTLDRKVAGSTRCCVLEQDTSFLLLLVKPRKLTQND